MFHVSCCVRDPGKLQLSISSFGITGVQQSISYTQIPKNAALLPIPDLAAVVLSQTSKANNQEGNKTFSCLLKQTASNSAQSQNEGGNAGKVANSELTMGTDLPTI